MTQHLRSLALRTYLFWSATAFVSITAAVWALDPERGIFGAAILGIAGTLAFLILVAAIGRID